MIGFLGQKRVLWFLAASVLLAGAGIAARQYFSFAEPPAATSASMPLLDDTVYYLRGAPTHLFAFNREFTPLSKETNLTTLSIDQEIPRWTRDDVARFEAVPILRSPFLYTSLDFQMGTREFSSEAITSPDGNTVFFTLVAYDRSPVAQCYEEPERIQRVDCPALPTPGIFYHHANTRLRPIDFRVYRYDVAQNTVTQLFSKADVSRFTGTVNERWILYVQSVGVSPDYLDLDLVQWCSACDHLPQEKIITHVPTGVVMNLGRTTAFEWLNDPGAFRFKNPVWAECDDPRAKGYPNAWNDISSCQIDPEKIPFFNRSLWTQR